MRVALPTLLALSACGSDQGLRKQHSDASGQVDTADTATHDSRPTGITETADTAVTDTAIDTAQEEECDRRETGEVSVVEGGVASLASGSVYGTTDWGDYSYANDFMVAASAGDLNGDGLDDLVTFEDRKAGKLANVVYGPVAGSNSLESVATSMVLESTYLYNPDSYDQLGAAGDVNDDGFGDLVIGSDTFDSGALWIPGKVYLFLGPLGSNPTTADAAATFVGPPDGSPTATNTYWSLAGASVSTAGDVNADGFDDILMGAPGADWGYAYLFYGPVSGDHELGYGGDVRITGTATSLDDRWDEAGRAVSDAGDHNGDGLDDILIAGFERTILLLAPLSDEYTYPDADAAFVETGAGLEHCGYRSSSAGDLDGDGYPDVLVDCAVTDTVAEYGAAALFHGPIVGERALETYDALIVGDGSNSGSYFFDVDRAGDVDADGRDDLVFGMKEETADDYSGYGAAYILLGDFSGVVVRSSAAVIVRGNEQGDWLGFTVAAGGDMDGDCLADVLVAAPGDSQGVDTEGHHGGAVWVVPGSLTRP